MAVFARQQATAARLIKKNGASATLRKFIPAATDPDKPWIQVPASTQDTAIDIVLFPFESKTDSLKTQSWMQKFADIPTGVMQGYFTHKTVKPGLSDVIIVNGKTYTLLNIDVLAPNAREVILYDVVLKA